MQFTRCKYLSKDSGIELSRSGDPRVLKNPFLGLCTIQFYTIQVPPAPSGKGRSTSGLAR